LNNLIGITIGDVSGIGPEIIIKALKRFSFNDRKKIIVFGEVNTLKKVNWESNLVSVIPVSIPNFKLIKGKNNPYSGIISFKAFELAVKFAYRGFIKAIVTAPISKKAWKLAGINYNGHTEYLSDLFKKDLLMAFHKGKLNTALVTEHVPIKDLPSKITFEKLMSKIYIFHNTLRDIFKIKKPKILISGFNPHCGEEGELGDEEIKVIKPLIKKLKKNKMFVSGPYNSDSILSTSEKKKAFNILFMYHDQLLSVLKNYLPDIPIVHATWNLPFIRTSPTHGTAFDIAWQNKADPSSMIAAIKMAINFSSNL